MSLVRQRLLLFLVPLFLSIPFLNRAYFVDDSYFVEIASWLKEHPSLPYHFRADDAGLQNRGWEENGFVRMVNPLTHHYYLAFLLKVFGEQEWLLRLGCVFLSCFSALFLFEFARRWTNHPLLSTLLLLVTPTLWLSSYSLLIDSTMVFFAFGGIYFFIRSTETGKIGHLIVSGVMMGFAILTKYPAMFVLPLSWTWLVLRWKKVERPWLYLLPSLIGLGFLFLYSFWTARLYGQPHIFAASARMLHVFGWPKLLVFFVFLSGSFLIPILSWWMVSGRTRIYGALMIFMLAIFLSTRLGGFTRLQGGLLGLWIVSSLLFVYALWLNRSELIFPRDYFLVLWFFGFVAMMLLVMDWVAVRYYCLLAPAMGFLCVRFIEMKWKENAPRVLIRTIGTVFVMTLALAYTDYKQAEPSRLIRSDLKSKDFLGGERHFYLGDSFTMSYLKRDGWIPCFPSTDLRVGDWILSKEVTMPLMWFARKPVVVRELAQFDYPSHWPIKVMDYAGSAGLYASVWGALPFTISTGPWERFHLYEIIGER